MLVRDVDLPVEPTYGAAWRWLRLRAKELRKRDSNSQ
jgi:hypothetical protein